MESPRHLDRSIACSHRLPGTLPRHPRLAAACFAFTFAQGWFLFRSGGGTSLIQRLAVDIFLYLGIVGGIPFLLINGVHGDSEGAAGIVGGALFVLVNAAVYYGLIVGIMKLVKHVTAAFHK